MQNRSTEIDANLRCGLFTLGDGRRTKIFWCENDTSQNFIRDLRTARDRQAVQSRQRRRSSIKNSAAAVSEDPRRGYILHRIRSGKKESERTIGERTLQNERAKRSKKYLELSCLLWCGLGVAVITIRLVFRRREFIFNHFSKLVGQSERDGRELGAHGDFLKRSNTADQKTVYMTNVAHQHRSSKNINDNI